MLALVLSLTALSSAALRLADAAATSISYSDLLCSSSEAEEWGPDDIVFQYVGSNITGIDAEYTEAYVSNGQYYPRGVYGLGIWLGGQYLPLNRGTLGNRTALIPRTGTRPVRGPPPSMPATDAVLSRTTAGPFAAEGTGSLLRLLVCCSRDNLLESVRMVRLQVGDTVIGVGTCTGYVQIVTRPEETPYWAGLQAALVEPLGSSEWVVSSLRLVWSSGDVSSGVRTLPPTPPSPPPPPYLPAPRKGASGGERARLPPYFPEAPAFPPGQHRRFPPPGRYGPQLLSKLPPGANPDWYVITSGVSNVTLTDAVTNVVMLGKTFPVVTTPAGETAVAAARFGKGALLSLGSESMVLRQCCRTPRGAALPGLDRLVLQGAMWAGWYGIKCGKARVKVSDERYVPFARWLVAQRPDLFAPSPEGHLQAPADFVRMVRGTVPQGKKPPTDLYVLGPGHGEEAYSPQLAAALQDFLAAFKGLILLGPDPPAAGGPGPSPTPLPSPSPAPAPSPKRQRPPKRSPTASPSPSPSPVVGDDDFEVIEDPPSPPPPAPAPAPPPTEQRRNKRRPPPSPPAAAARRVLLGPGLYSQPDRSLAFLGSGPDSVLGSGPDSQSRHSGPDAGPDSESGDSGLGPRVARVLTQFSNGSAVNKVAGPLGIVSGPANAPAVQPATYEVGPTPPSDLLNAEAAAGAYVQYLQGKAPASLDVTVVLSVISKARAAITRDDPGSSSLYTLLDAIAELGGSVPEYDPRASNPPPPPPARRMPPPPAPRAAPSGRPPPPAGAGSLSWTFLGCYRDAPAASARTLPLRLAGADRALTVERCAALAGSAGVGLFGLQGSACLGGSDQAAATGLGRVGDAECATVCGGNRAQACGLVSATRLLVSLYRVVRAG